MYTNNNNIESNDDDADADLTTLYIYFTQLLSAKLRRGNFKSSLSAPSLDHASSARELDPAGWHFWNILSLNIPSSLTLNRNSFLEDSGTCRRLECSLF